MDKEGLGEISKSSLTLLYRKEGKEMFSKKQIIILIVLVLILAGGIFLYWQKYDKWPWQKEVSVATPTATASPESGVLSTVKTDRDFVMEDVAAKISQLSPEPPVLGGQWFVSRFWFVDGSNNTFYVEYEDGHILRQLLLVADLSQMPNKISYAVKAFFTPGESDWVLQSGKDEAIGRNLILYEYEQTAGKWGQRN
ncbi:MAG: hypothetical protein A3B04_02820 [Candidatus Portnoybacteria bacterium RIFCSPLOWO2_02_FULL_39_11]|uniref:Uncharacterized protein n=1 Tax=Candidatus Portnoybacteria bacterium RIFCSPLOWO2_02_FULL_39_11 TaxID=1802001 RepID=A0A1G2FU14_9BACT|nr:MAG: hypothetical protein A3B04_02820 [Candidatus Portnoybacteria bacterium RIFCSPLOWO2_02_FULL_39_11]